MGIKDGPEARIRGNLKEVRTRLRAGSRVVEISALDQRSLRGGKGKPESQGTKE